MIAKKGQGTIEYLVIIAIVIVIALVVVGLLLQILQNSGGAGDSAAKATWKSGSPWGISDWAYGSDGNLTLVLVNNSSDTLELNNVAITGGTYRTASVTTVPPSGGQSIVKVAITCTSGTKAAFKKSDVSIDYNSPSIDNKTQGGAADIVVNCP